MTLSHCVDIAKKKTLDVLYRTHSYHSVSIFKVCHYTFYKAEVLRCFGVIDSEENTEFEWMALKLSIEVVMNTLSH